MQLAVCLTADLQLCSFVHLCRFRWKRERIVIMSGKSYPAQGAGSAFLLDSISPRTLTICRSLGRRKIRVDCGSEISPNLAFFSRYCQSHVTYPSPQRSAQEFVQFLLDYLDRHPHDCLIPVKEESLDTILSYRREFDARTRLPFPPDPVYRVCRDKSKTMEIAAQLNIPHPVTVVPSDLAQVRKLACTLTPPLVVKPRLNCGGLGIRYVSDIHQLYDIYCQVHQKYPFPIIQEQIPSGEKLDVACLLDENSRALATFVQKEIRSFPLHDGASTVQQSVWRPDLVEITLKFLEKVGWYGIAEAEFIIDPRTNTPLLLEVNPRFWGSLQLAIQSGVDFPFLLYQLAVGEKIEPIHAYKVGQLCRQVIPHDIMHFLANPNRFHMEPGFFDFFNPDCGYTLFSPDDPGPVLGFLLSCVRYAFDPDKWLHLARMEGFANRLGSLLNRESQPIRVPVKAWPTDSLGQSSGQALKQSNWE
jgi:predicted ATP-grasp superfamily ATP-dependent carboligase